MHANLRMQWETIALPGFLLSGSVTLVAIAAAPIALRSVAIPSWVRLATAAAVGLQAIAASSTAAKTERWVTARRGTTVATGAVLGLAIARFAAVNPWSVIALVGAQALMSALVGSTQFVCTAAGIALGASSAMITAVALPSLTDLSLTIDRTYRGAPIAPLWLPLSRALAVAALSIVAGGSAVLAGSQRRHWRGAIRRYRAIERIVTGRKHLEAGQGARALLALADRSWAVIGIAAVEWEVVHITITRPGVTDNVWRRFAHQLQDAVVAVRDESNPIAQCARSGVTVAIGSSEELVYGTWRRFATEDLPRGAHGWAIPFGRPEARAVLFALSNESRVDTESLGDLAAALALLDAGEGNRTGVAP